MTSCLGIYIEKSFIKYAKLQKYKDDIKIIDFNVEYYEKIGETLKKIINKTNSSKIPIYISVENDLKMDFDKYIEKNNVKFVPSKNIINLIKIDKKDNIAIINIEDKTQIDIIIDGKFEKSIILDDGLNLILKEMYLSEKSIQRSYETYKTLVIPTKKMKILDEDDEKAYLEKLQKILYKIAQNVKKILEKSYKNIDKIYITGAGANIQNIENYFEDYLQKIKCEILKPFFIETPTVRTSLREYLEVNTAISIALDGLNNEDRKENSKINQNNKLSVSEKLMLRLCSVFFIIIISFFSFSNQAYQILEESKNSITQVSDQTYKQFTLMNNDLNKIKSKSDEYAYMIENVKSLTEIENYSQKSRIVSKNSIPNMLNQIIKLTPREVKIISITNLDDSKQILIEVESEKYEQLGYFSSILKTENVLKNIKSTSGSKNKNIVRVTIEGELP